MLTKIAAFEVRYQLRSPLFFVGFALFFLLTFGATTIDQIQIGSLGNVNINSPFAILQTTSIMNIFGLFVLVAFVANVVIRDDETGFAPIVRSTRITKFDYLVGRFVGAYLVAFATLVSVPLAILVGSWMPWLDVEKVGTFQLGHYLYALFVCTAPTVFTLGAGFFALATATRSMMWTYVGAVAFLVAFFVSQLFLDEPHLLTASSLADPFSLGALQQVTRYWTAAERNTLLPDLTGVWLHNRLIWTGAAVVLFAIAYGLFRFESKSKRGKDKAASEEPSPARLVASTAIIATPRAAWRQFVALTRFDMATVFKSPAFFVLLAIGILNSFGSLLGTVEDRGVAYFPVTRAIVDALNGAFTFFPVIIAIYYAGELVWRDRDQRMHEIVDATGAPNWTFMVPKAMAITLVLAACFVVASITGILFQLAHGYSRLELSAYLLWFFVPGVIQAILLAALSVFAQVLSPHKAIGWALMLVYLVSSFALPNAGLEHNLYNYAGTPGTPLSDMNGLGRFWIGRVAFEAYWLAFALLLLVAAQLLWRRGVDTSLMPRLRRSPSRFAGGARVTALLAVAALIGVGTYIYYNTNVLNDYVTRPELDKRLADYEKTLLPFESAPQPTIVDVKLKVDIEPREVSVTTSGEYLIENRTGEPLSEIHVRWIRPLQMTDLQIDGATLSKEFGDFDYRIYALSQPMQPQEQRTLRFISILEQKGFVNRRPLIRIVDNGTFVNNLEISPQLGMSRDNLLTDRSRRRKYGLPADLRPAKLEDQSARAHHVLRRDSDFVTAQIEVTTDADQTPVAPGYTVSDTVTGNRRTLVTRTDAPIEHFFSIQSARYAVKKESWTNSKNEPVELAVYYHPQHDHNVQRMLDAMKTSLTMFEQRFSPYQFHQARVLEFPTYERFAQSFANTIPYSEGIGFIQNYDENRADEQIDLVTYVTAHEIAHQWWGHQVVSADQQGATMLIESFAQYSALLVMEHLYGKEQIRKFLKYELDRYLQSRGSEVVEELPLARVENQPYIHYRKGSLVMYWLKEAVGEEVVNQAMRNLIAEFAFKPAPYPSPLDFLRHLRAVAGDQNDELIADLFEKITLYDMKATDAQAKKLSDGTYQVTFTVEGKKLYADGQGKETEADMSEAFDIGVFTAEPGKKGYRNDSVVHLDRRTLHGGKQEIELIVDREPKFVGVDPFNMRIDRNADDNIASVSIESSP